MAQGPASTFSPVNLSATTFSPINVFDIHLKKGGSLPLTFQKRTIPSCVINGSIDVNSEEAPLHSFVLSKNQGEEIEITAKEESVLLLLSGEPIEEPIAQYGPFVMNTQQEILKPSRSFRRGSLGNLCNQLALAVGNWQTRSKFEYFIFRR